MEERERERMIRREKKRARNRVQWEKAERKERVNMVAAAANSLRTLHRIE